MAEDVISLFSRLDSAGLADWRYYPELTSTNDLALDWAGEGAADFSLILADAQTAGRGRENRQWVTRPGTALAFSLILRPGKDEEAYLPRFTALAALSLLDALDKAGIPGGIKWPNDVLISRKKVAGILVEADWQGTQTTALVMGMGVNITPDAVPPAESLRYPATSVESELGRKIDRWAFLASILHAIKRYRGFLTSPEFIRDWNDRLAFRGEMVSYRFSDGEVRTLEVVGVQPDGRLTLRTQQGETLDVVAGEIEIESCDRGSSRKVDGGVL